LGADPAPFCIFEGSSVNTVADRILLLPDHIANQIAAGEVIQRPASAVKELLENAVDAGASEIRLFVNDAGKSLIQVIDNGGGMSETDARMCFERHATSKIRNIDDLFHIRTMGFRGEALASIAAVAQVELRSRRPSDETGVYIEIENSIVTRQEPVATVPGTSICMKNLFFNVPARRNFLKSNAAEMRHIVDEFIRVALAFPSLFFSLTSNGQQIFHLEAGSLKQRITQLLGNNYNARLVAVNEETDYLNIHGFVGKPDTAKKTRGDQYFFVNNRFVRSPYLNHAIMNAFQDMIASDSFPLYVLFIDLDPAQVDVNVHPTKQEIKFEDEKIVYAFIQAAVKHALAQFSITPTLDFNLDNSIQQLESIQKPFTEDKQSATKTSQIFQTFTEANQAHKIDIERKHWSDLHGDTSLSKGSQEGAPFQSLGRYFMEMEDQNNTPPAGQSISAGSLHVVEDSSSGIDETARPVQLFNSYIVFPSRNSFYLVHQQSAHERIIYNRLIEAMQGRPVATQRSLFPSSIQLTPADAVLLNELLPDLAQMGYMVEPFGPSAFVIQGTPADIQTGNEKLALENLLEQYKHFSNELKLSKRETLLRTVAAQQAIRPGSPLTEKEMQQLISDLFRGSQPNTSPSGKPTYLEITKEQLGKMFMK
jgi:DNA mismatch repair protein MutL